MKRNQQPNPTLIRCEVLIIFPHFSHLDTCNGSYIGIRTLTLGSGECFHVCSFQPVFSVALSFNLLFFLLLCLLGTTLSNIFAHIHRLISFWCFFQCARYMGHFILSLHFLHSGRRLVQYRLQGRLVGGGVFAVGVDILGSPLA